MPILTIKNTPVELISNAVSEIDLVIKTAYKQVFGNIHLLESQRLLVAESQLQNGQITVMEFIRQLAKSELYRSVFFEKHSNLRVVELNFKHLLGRAPDNYAEVSAHIDILVNQGFEAEIDSYLDSNEYFQIFGTNVVPYYRGVETITGLNLGGYINSIQLAQSASSSDLSTSQANYQKLDKNLLDSCPKALQPKQKSAPLSIPESNEAVDVIRRALNLTYPNTNSRYGSQTSYAQITSEPTEATQIIRKALQLN